MGNEFLTITEFAREAGVSRQTVYNRLESLGEFVKIDNGVKLVSREALERFSPGPVHRTRTDSKLESKDNASPSNVDTQKDTLIQQQQALISSQNEQIRELQAQIMAQNKELTTILQQQTELQRNFQVLLADSKRHVMLPAVDTVDTSTQSMDWTQRGAQTGSQPVNQTSKETPIDTSHNCQLDKTETDNRGGFFARFFGRK